MSEVLYQTTINLAAKNNCHTMAYEYVEKVARGKALQILEVGCSTAYFGSALKSAGHVVWGIEPNKVSAAIAGTKLDYVFVGIVEDFIQKHPDKKFDVIVFGDVLEHIVDPSEVLNQCHSLLVEGGVIVASIPNVSHIAIRAMLLDARWEYGDLGILDRTHLRFFTRQTILELFHDSLYSVIDINAVKVTAEAAASLSKITLSPNAVACAKNYATDDYLYDFQYVLFATPSGSRVGRGGELLLEEASTKVLGIVQDTATSLVDVRLRQPLELWAKECNGELKLVSLYDCSEQDILWADVIIVQRVAEPRVMWALGRAKHFAKKVIFEIDDLLIDLPDFLQHHKTSLAGYSVAIESIIPQVDYVTVTTKKLGKQMERFSRPIAVIPNCANDNHLGATGSSNWQNGRATLIVASTDAVLVDFVLPAISLILNRKDILVSVVVIGPPGDAFEKAGIKFDKMPNMPYIEFKKYIRTLDNPIGLIPLDESLFSSCKSPVKYFDYCLAGIPVICSNTPPYSDVVVNGLTGLLTTNESASWGAAIEELVISKALRVRMSEQALIFVKDNYATSNTVRHWDALIHKLKLQGEGKAPTLKSYFSQKVSHFRFIGAHVFRYGSYKAVAKIVKRDGVKAFITRLVRGWF